MPGWARNVMGLRALMVAQTFFVALFFFRWHNHARAKQLHFRTQP